MKRAIDTSRTKLFQKWVKQHNPKLKWNFNNPVELRNQLVQTIKESGDLDIKSVFNIIWANEDSGLTFKQNERFLNEEY